MVKKLRSKDGYVLAYVVVVITILMAVAAGTALAATRNLSAQTEAVKQLEARYAAEGELEKLVGEIWKNIKNWPPVDGVPDNALEYYKNNMLNPNTSTGIVDGAEIEGNSIIATLNASDSDGDATITAKVKIDCTVTMTATSGGESKSKLTPQSITYLSYDITYTD